MDIASAINTIVNLDQYGALIISATSSQKEEEQRNKRVTISINQQPVKNDSISFYYMPDKIHPDANCDGGINSKGAKTNAKALWRRLLQIYKIKDINRKIITISTKGSQSSPPLLRTRSALEILKFAAEPDSYQLISITNDVQSIRDLAVAHKQRIATLSDCADDFYTGQEVKLRQNKIFMLIARSDSQPSDAFVSVYDSGSYYSILNGDQLSKRTLALIAQFNTILAVPSASAPLTPTISVGAKM
jgi:hypothetical protein